MSDRLELLSDHCRSLQGEIQSPHDSTVEECLFLILEELREIEAKLAVDSKVSLMANGTAGKSRGDVAK